MAGIVGAGHDAYVRILHPIPVERVDPERVDEDGFPVVLAEEEWTWARLAKEVGADMHPLVQWPSMVGDRDHFDLPTGARVSPPPDGGLAPRLLAALVTHGRDCTVTPDDVVAAFWNGWSLSDGAVRYSVDVNDDGDGDDDGDPDDDPFEAHLRAIDPTVRRAIRNGPFLSYPAGGFGVEYALFQTSLDELSDPAWVYRAGIGWADGWEGILPQLIWPEDHTWVIASEIDFSFTIVGGTRALVDAVLDDDRFEAYEVSAGDDLTRDGDTINGTRRE